MGKTPQSYRVVSVFCSVSLSLNAHAYIVKKGESFSKIIGRNLPGLVYGRNGNFDKILKLNPQIKNPHLIIPGTEINLGDAGAVVSDVSVAEEKEVRNVASPDFAPVPESSPTSFEFNPYFVFSNLSVRDRSSGAKAELASELYAGGRFSYIQGWSEEFQSYLQLNFAYVTFEQPTTSQVSLKDSNRFLTGLSLGGKYHFKKNLRGYLHADYQKELFVRSIDTTTITVDGILVPSVGSNLEYDFLNYNNLILGISGKFDYKLASKADSYRVNNGYVYGAGLYLKEIKGIQTDLSFYTRGQDSTITQQKETGVFLSVKMMVPHGNK